MKEKKPTYQRYELEALLGEFVSNYDVDAIEDEATDTDASGNRVWNVNPEELAAIMERHDLTTPQRQPQEGHTMTVNDLNREQLEELAQNYFTEHYNEYNPEAAELEGPSYGELASALEIVGLDTLKEEYAGTDFTNDDFFSTAAQPERYEVRQIDAYLYDDSWTWNTSYLVGTFATYSQDVPRALRRYLKSQGITFVKGRTRTEYDGDIFEIVDRATHEPLFAAIPRER